MNQQRHTFSGKRIACPRCGSSRGFAPTVGDPTQGYCHACQTPLFGKATQGQIAPPPRPRTERPQPPTPRITVDGSDPLSRYLIGLWQGGEPMRLHLRQWSVGATLDGRTCFAHGTTTSKIMRYGIDGRRDKNSPPSWFPSGAAVPIFGCGWLADNAMITNYQTWQQHTFTTATPVFIVESEKSAVLGSFAFPQFVWLAAGGSSGITERKAQALRGRRVGVLFDADEAGQTGAIKARDILNRAGATPRVLSLRDLIPNAPNGMDIGDAVISQLQKPLAYTEEYERSTINWVARWN